MYGITTRRTLVRKFPNYLADLDENGFNLNIESSLLPCAGVKILDKSDEMYLTDAGGWVDCRDIAIGDMPSYDKFAIVTDKSVNICGNEYFMSTKFPVKNNKLMLPLSDGGNLKWILKSIPQGVRCGYLENTPQNIISQAAKLLGMPYDWGEEHGSVDCSAFTGYVYATVGIRLPRNSAEQKKFAAACPESAKMGDIVYIPGHVMIYIENNLVIHASCSAGRVCISQMPC